MKNKLKNKKDNELYYAFSDGNFMDTNKSLYAHKYLDRIAWVRKWVHSLGSHSHIDIATKDGYLPLLLQAEGIESIGIDPSEDAIDFAKVKAQQTNLDVVYLKGYFDEVPDYVHADTASALEVIEHVLEPEELVKKLCTIGSYVFVSTPDKHGRHGEADQERNQEHLRLYTKESLEELMSKYGEIIESVIRDDQILVLIKVRK